MYIFVSRIDEHPCFQRERSRVRFSTGAQSRPTKRDMYCSIEQAVSRGFSIAAFSPLVSRERVISNQKPIGGSPDKLFIEKQVSSVGGRGI